MKKTLMLFLALSSFSAYAAGEEVFVPLSDGHFIMARSNMDGYCRDRTGKFEDRKMMALDWSTKKVDVEGETLELYKHETGAANILHRRNQFGKHRMIAIVDEITCGYEAE
ncbi:MAG: hypothetical protein H7301_14545 [Cryobacterium sp.]|nr:hypothetical protein [Oligoflexia bacterium]